MTSLFDESQNSGVSVTELEIRLVHLREQMKQIVADNETAVEEAKELDSQKAAAYEAYQQAVMKIKERKEEVDKQVAQFKRDMRKMRDEEDALARQIEQDRRMRELEMEFDTLSKDWLDQCANAPWFAAAFPHQIEAGRKIAYSRSLILADIMGLGKTLSSILAVDMIRVRQNKDEVETSERTGYHQYSELNQYICTHCATIAAAGGDLKAAGYSWQPTHYGKYNHTVLHRAAGKRILYLCPTTLVKNVEREFKRWAPHRGLVVNLAGKTKAERRVTCSVLANLPEYVVVCNYEAWVKDLSFIDSLIDCHFDTIILDEAHNLKEPGTIKYRGVRDIVVGKRVDYRTGEVISEGFPIEFVIPMTGSPILNKPQDLYSLLSLVDREQFPPNKQGLDAYLSDYCQQNWSTKRWAFNPGGLERLTKKIGNRFLRRTHKDAGIVLPKQDIVFHEIEIDEELYKEQARARKEMRENAMIMLDAAKGEALLAMAKLAVITRLRQIETWPDGIILKDSQAGTERSINIRESQKLDYVISPDGLDGLLPEVCPEQRTVIFSQFTEPLREIARRAEKCGIRAVILDGNTSSSIREAINRNFDRSTGEPRRWDLVLCNYKVGGLGLNFTDATQTIVLDEEWNPGKRDQAYMRTWRIGQTEETTVHLLLVKQTIDTWMHALMNEKENMVEGFNDSISTAQFFQALKDGEI